MKTSTIIILVLILLIIISSVCVYFFFKRKVENFSMKVFGTKDIMAGFKEQELEYQETPKSVSSMDSVIIPKIEKDFPHTDVNELEKMAENALILYFKSLEKKKLLKIENASDKLNNKIKTEIEENQFDSTSKTNMKIHTTVINEYKNKGGSCNVTFQTSLEYIESNKKNKKKVQARYKTELIYVYDETEVEGVYGVSLNCPNCGAPVKNLGSKKCPYCESAILEYTKKVWKVNEIYKQ